MVNLRKSGLAILITDHNVRETLSIVDRAYFIFDGRVESEGTKDFLINDPISRQLLSRRALSNERKERSITTNAHPHVKVTGRHLQITDAISDYCTRKIENLHLDYPKIIEAHVILEEKYRHSAEVVLALFESHHDRGLRRDERYVCGH